MSTPPPPPPQQYTPAPPLNPADEKTWSILTHIGGIFFGFLPSLIVFLVFKGRGPFLEAHSKAALNFQISWTIYAIGGSIAIGIITAVTLGLGAVLFAAVYLVPVVVLIFSIIAAVKASQGQYYTYPLTIALIK
jgi:uncharacterized Tic20 family protein